MARKKVEKAHWMPDEKLRPLTFHDDEDDVHKHRENVTRVLDDLGLRTVQHEVVSMRSQMAEAQNAVALAKNALKKLTDRERLLVDSLVCGTLREWREVYAYADDAEQLVHLYDPADKTLLATRPLSHHERQMEFDYGPDKVRDFDPETANCPTCHWHDMKRDETQDADGKQAWICEEGCGRLMWDAAAGEGLFYESTEVDDEDADDDDQESDHDAEDEGNA